jgi:hypothetical protein
VQPTDSPYELVLNDLLDLKLPESLQRGQTSGQRVQLRDRLFVGVSLREVTECGLGPVHEYPLRDLSAGGMSITSSEPVAVGSVLEVEGCINHHLWKGRLEVVHCTTIDDQYKIGMKLIRRIDTAQATLADRIASLQKIPVPREAAQGTVLESSLAEVEIDLDQVRAAFRTAEKIWDQLGNTARKLILKAAHTLPPDAAKEPEADTRKHSRKSTNIDATMIVKGAESWRRLPIHVTDVSEGGIRGEIPKEQLDGAGPLHKSRPVMMVFGTGASIIYLPAEIVHCQGDHKHAVSIGVQFITPTALQFFGA